MMIAFALAFAAVLIIAEWWHGSGVWAALLIGAGLGAWLKSLIDQRIRHITGASTASEQKKPDAVFAALGDIHWRLKRLEEAKGLGASPLEQQANAAADDTGTAPEDMVFELDPGLSANTAAPVTAAIPSAAEPVAAAQALPVNTPHSTPRSTRTNWPEKNAINAGSDVFERARAWLLGGNTVVRVGIVILFFGVAFLLKFAAEHAVLPLELRVAAVGAGAIALLMIGWRLRLQREAYALALQGAGIGLLYLTLFGAFRLYTLIPPSLALAAMVMVSALSALLAVVQNSRALISIAVIGGFLAPVLASTGSGNHVLLFSYYAILNLGIFAVAWFKAWRPLNLLGFFFTFGIGMSWGAKAYQPELFSSTEPFLLLFFSMFLGIAILFAHKQAPGVGAWLSEAADGGISIPPRIVDSTLVFGLPLVAFGFQAELTKGMPFALAYSAMALAALYLGLARWLQGRAHPDLHLLTESFLALGVIFATLAIPLALDARWTSASWALEGAALIWVGLRQQRRLARAFGVLLQLAAAVAYFNRAHFPEDTAIPVLNAACTGGILIALSAFFTAWQLQKQTGKNLALWERDGAVLVFFWGLAWWLQAGFAEAGRLLDAEYSKAFALIFPSLTAVAFSILQRRLSWAQARLPAAGLMLFLLAVFAFCIMDDAHPLSAGGWLGWPLALLMHFWLLRRYDEECFPEWFVWVHALGFWLLAALGAWELHWLAHENGLLHDSWSAAAVIVVPGLLLFSVSRTTALTRWPLRRFAPSYLGWGAWPLLTGLAAWCVFTDFSNPGNATPLPYFPLLNPVDLGHVFVLLVGIQWAQKMRQHPEHLSQRFFQQDTQQIQTAVGVLVFIWLNAMLLRSIHQWLDVPYTLHDLFSSVLVQAALSLFWSLIALTLMLTGTRRGWRRLWILGAALMAVVVVKLFFVDLGNIASVARIVSFIGVGLLMLLIGYVAPVPPEQIKETTEEKEST